MKKARVLTVLSLVLPLLSPLILLKSEKMKFPRMTKCKPLTKLT